MGGQNKKDDNRWFIWTIVIIVVLGVGLATYINYVTSTDNATDFYSTIMHHPKNVHMMNQGIYNK